YHPVPFLKAARQRLRANGHMVVAVPDMGSIWRRAMGRRWPSFKFPEHVTFFDASTLRDALARSGFSNIRPVAYPHAFPVSLIVRKLGLGWWRGMPDPAIWLPATTVAMVGCASE
ncbi:MAG: hypothetical protein R3C97_18155, partial [Geminicoccaceae bacterium]